MKKLKASRTPPLSEPKRRRNFLRRRRAEEQKKITAAVRTFADNPFDSDAQATFLRAMSSKRAAKKYGDVAAVCAAATNRDELEANVRDLILSLGDGGGNSCYRATLTTRLTKGLSQQYVVNALELDTDYVRCARHTVAKSERLGQTNILMSSAHSVTKTTQRTRDDSMDPEFLSFFEDQTFQLSGADTLTRVLPKSKHELMRSLYARMPSLCRRFGDRALPSNGEKPLLLSRKIANALAATFTAGRPGFSVTDEEKERSLIFSVRHGETSLRRRYRGLPWEIRPVLRRRQASVARGRRR